MIRKIIFTGLVYMCITGLAFGQTFNTEDEELTYFTENAEASANAVKANPLIESILENPDVLKKELAQNFIRAIGHREGNKQHFIIHFKKRQLHGDWQSFYHNDQLCDSGRLDKNLPDGEWKTWYSNGQLKSVRNYSADKYRYIKADIRRNHPRYQKYQLTRYAQLKKHIAHYFQPAFYNNHAAAKNLSMLDKIQHNTDSEGNSYIAPFENCVHHGMFINYHENGAVKDSGHYVNGLKHGLWEETSSDGNILAFGLYQHGHKQSQWKYYDKSGKLLYTEFYKKNGKQKVSHHFRK